MTTGPSHTFEEHTGELRLRLDAPTVEGLFVEAARALAELAVGTDERLPEPEGEPEPVRLESVDREALLVDWLNELIFRTEIDGKAYVDCRLARIDESTLEATIRGASHPALRPLVKAATLHGVHITEKPHGYSVTVILDI
ncbi:archease [Polyangium aurulentum]|uniref:archease n=1 Tax=Polyangium aurulentum TaxID=2567896 RepID=UPI00146C77A5|nr:archease [Polyangium aurulentum]UQA57697.1 archease [Polyangium aurulentum]